MTLEPVDSGWWPYLFILLVGWLPNDVWRFVGVVASGRIRPDGEWIIAVRAVANALVAAVIARLIFAPSGALAEVDLAFRLAAFGTGFMVFVFAGQRLLLALLTGEAVLLLGWWLT